MEALLGIIIIIAPIFTIVAVWTKLSKAVWSKILVTTISVMSVGIAIGLGTEYNKVQDQKKTLEYAVERDMDYLQCLDDSEGFDAKFNDCILPNIKLLSETYNK